MSLYARIFGDPRRIYEDPDRIADDGLHWKRMKRCVALEAVENGRTVWRQSISGWPVDAAKAALLRAYEDFHAGRG